MTTATEELKRLVERATPGEWKADLDGSIKIRHDDLAWLTLCPSMSSFGGYDAWPETKANAGLIALTPTLAAEVIASRTTIEALQARVKRWKMRWRRRSTGRTAQHQHQMAGPLAVHRSCALDQIHLAVGRMPKPPNASWRSSRNCAFKPFCACVSQRQLAHVTISSCIASL
jgi:hypothetical protein